MKLGWQGDKWLRKKSKMGFRGYPVGTVAFYGPDNTRASKVAVSIVVGPDSEPIDMKRWYAESGDLRKDANIATEIAEYLRSNDVHSVAMTEGLLGCPHEERTDYPEGQSCPHCPYWAGRDRWTGDKIEE